MQTNNEIICIAPSIFRKVLKLMGNRFEISIVDEEEHTANNKIDAAVAEIKRIEALLTTFSETSQTNLINRNAGIAPVKVDRELFDLLTRCNHISRITQGAFDITYGSADKRFWNFDKQMKSLPDAETAKQHVMLINFRNVILDEETQTVFLKEPGMADRLRRNRKRICCTKSENGFATTRRAKRYCKCSRRSYGMGLSA